MQPRSWWSSPWTPTLGTLNSSYEWGVCVPWHRGRQPRGLVCASEPSTRMGTKEAKLKSVDWMWNCSYNPSLDRQDAKMLNLVVWFLYSLLWYFHSLLWELNKNVTNSNSVLQLRNSHTFSQARPESFLTNVMRKQQPPKKNYNAQLKILTFSSCCLQSHLGMEVKKLLMFLLSPTVLRRVRIRITWRLIKTEFQTHPQSFWCSKAGMGLRKCISDKFLGDADAAGPGTMLGGSLA